MFACAAPGPSRQNARWGNPLVRFQEGFCVRSRREPDSLTSRGSAAERPNGSRSHTSSGSVPNSFGKNRLPCAICRASAAPPGIPVPASTRIPPTAANRPAAACSRTRADTSGRC